LAGTNSLSASFAPADTITGHGIHDHFVAFRRSKTGNQLNVTDNVQGPAGQDRPITHRQLEAVDGPRRLVITLRTDNARRCRSRFENANAFAASRLHGTP